MEKSNDFLSAPTNTTKRAALLFEEHRQQIFQHTDRLFAGLMIFQWLAGIAAAIWISPRTWVGQFSQVHLHVLAAIFLGGIISVPPIILGFAYSGKALTRYVIAVSQMLTSALLIHLSGGRIETHFHVFGSLAFLAFYRDWRVLIPATGVIALDHLMRGLYWPQSVFGVLVASPWRWLEHAAWVIFEDIFLVISCQRSTHEMKEIAQRTAQMEATHQIIEEKVEERTRELVTAKENLENEMMERKKLEGVIIQSEKMAAIGQLAGGVAHEINNPLGIILGFAQNVVKRIQPGDPFEMPLASIEREAIRCKKLVQDLLTFSRLEKEQKEEIHLNDAIETALTLVEAQGKVKKIEIEKKMQPNLPKILGNSTQIQQVVINLSNNAIDAMPNGGKLTLRTKTAGFNGKSAIAIDVEDTGSGIPAAVQKRIFEPFFTTKELGKGTGLGLSLVYEIIQKHKGTISIESHEGGGTVFHILLPIQESGSS